MKRSAGAKIRPSDNFLNNTSIMELQTKNNIKLGLLVLSGLVLLILILYGVGKDQSLFGSNFQLKARFVNVSGLMKGNNIRFSGIQVGTVRNIEILDDTTIEVTMLIDKKVKAFIHTNAIVSIGTEGLMGNKIINILPSASGAPVIEADVMLASQKNINTDEMMQTLYRTNNNIAEISEDLRKTVQSIRNSSALRTLLNDSGLAVGLRTSLAHIDQATVNTQSFTRDLRDIIAQTKDGKGTVGQLLTDTAFYGDLRQAALTIGNAGKEAGDLVAHLDEMVLQVQQDLKEGKGTANALLRDSIMAMKLNASLDNVQKGTDGFNQNMEALKHNFLFRGYFRRLEKQKKK
jgi:phospholipid/cholesterol/gamma-HCH transport system substrate-binding protein